MVTCGLGPTGWANTRVSDAGDTSTVASALGVLLVSELSAADAGDAQVAVTSAAVSSARHQRSAAREVVRVEFFKVAQR